MRNFFLLLLMVLSAKNTVAQEKKKQYPASDKPPVMVEQPAIASIPESKTNDSSLVDLKEILKEEFRSSKKYTEKSSDTSGEKQILSVIWMDTRFNKISSISRSELISLAVLTKGYQIGDTIRVTIASDDDASLLADEPCHNVIFTGIQEFEDMAVLKDIFTVEGAEEQMVILPAWKNRYRCKEKKEEE